MMANEIQADWGVTGRTAYAQLRSAVAQIWSTSGGTGAFGAYSAASWSDYALSASEQGGTGYYAASVPAAVPPGTYSVLMKDQLGGSPQVTDATVAEGVLNWATGAAAVVANGVSSGQFAQNFPATLGRGRMVTNFSIYLKSAVDHVTPLVSGICSGQIARDAGNFGPLQSGAFVERGLGFYDTTLTSGDLLAGAVRLLFTATSVSGAQSDPLPMTFLMQRASGF